jgi:hypothetical protein
VKKESKLNAPGKAGILGILRLSGGVLSLRRLIMGKREQEKPGKKGAVEEDEITTREESSPPPEARKTKPKPAPVGVPVGSLALGAKFTMGGEVYRKDSGPGNRIIGTRLIKTPTTGDTWIPSDQQTLDPETLVESY